MFLAQRTEILLNLLRSWRKNIIIFTVINPTLSFRTNHGKLFSHSHGVSDCGLKPANGSVTETWQASIADSENHVKWSFLINKKKGVHKAAQVRRKTPWKYNFEHYIQQDLNNVTLIHFLLSQIASEKAMGWLNIRRKQYGLQANKRHYSRYSLIMMKLKKRLNESERLFSPSSKIHIPLLNFTSSYTLHTFNLWIWIWSYTLTLWIMAPLEWGQRSWKKTEDY